MREFHKIHRRYRPFRICSAQQFLLPIFILVITDLIAVTLLSDRQVALRSLLKDQQPFIICKLCTHLKYLPCDIRKVYQLTGKNSLRYVLCRLQTIFRNTITRNYQIISIVHYMLMIVIRPFII